MLIVGDDMELYVIRHGETYPNTLDEVYGRRECDLTKKGKDDARKLRDEISDLSFDHIFVSPLRRARQTADIIGRRYRVKNILTERCYGKYEGMNKYKIRYLELWNYDINYCSDGVESVREILSRAYMIIFSLKRLFPNERILLITHSGLMRAIHYALVGIPDDGDLSKLKLPNLSIKHYVI